MKIEIAHICLKTSYHHGFQSNSPSVIYFEFDKKTRQARNGDGFFSWVERFGTIAFEFLRRIHPVERANSGRAGFILQPDLFLHNPIAKKLAFSNAILLLFLESERSEQHLSLEHHGSPQPWPYPPLMQPVAAADRSHRVRKPSIYDVRPAEWGTAAERPL